MAQGNNVKLNPTISFLMLYQGASTVAVSGAYIFFRGHYATDARGRKTVLTSGQILEGDHEKHSQRS